MSRVSELLEAKVYGLNKQSKQELLLGHLNRLSINHYENCPEYRHILNAYGNTPGKAAQLEDIPFLPVRLFKHAALKSISDDEIIKTLTSSGTSGQTPSRIFLDKQTSAYQTKALVRIMQTFLGKQRLPMIIIDHQSVIKDRKLFSARGAGILGLANFGRKHFYALEDEDMTLKLKGVVEYIEDNPDTPVLLFGFTFMVWRYFVQALENAGKRLDLSNAVLIHSGGWKKLEDEAVDNETFKARLKAVTGITRVHNFYGMVEQVGSIFVECEQGHLHAPLYSDLLIRDASDWSLKDMGEEGIIQLLSILPHSYPGHSLMTEDRGIILGEDDCKCGRKGKYFKILGRVPSAEVRGCSDTHTQQAA